MNVAVVVAAYTEDTSWMGLLPSTWDVYVYDKMTAYPNVGREAETYARFVYEQYETLEKYTDVVFLQGHPFDHFHGSTDGSTADLIQAIEHRHDLGSWVVCDANGLPDHPGLPLSVAHSRIFERGATPQTYRFIAGAQYTVSTGALRRRPRTFWHRLHTDLFNQTICAWTMERMWPEVFFLGIP
jgi:hypothetical protein